MKTNQLTKSSTSTEIKSYFSKILQLSKLEEQFPVNLEEVWPLIYERKDYAVKELKKNFIENIDYQMLLQKAEQKQRGGTNKTYYYLSVSCLEYFIARKIRPVFEVYRQVFHSVASVVEIEDSKNRISEKISAESMQRNLRMMHEQLFANMENLGMLFNPIHLQVSSFAWDVTRSVRANIREFINNYYRLALGASRLLREKTIRENENTRLIKHLEREYSLYRMKYEGQCDILKHKQYIVDLLLNELEPRR